MRSLLRRVLGAAAGAAALASTPPAEAETGAVYSLAAPGATPLYVAVPGGGVDAVYAEWATNNAAVAPAAGAFDRDACAKTNEIDRATELAAPVRTLYAAVAVVPPALTKPLHYRGS